MGKIHQTVGNTYGFRTWIEYGFKQSKNELGWADYRVTDYTSIERWWELIFCAYTLVSFQCSALQRGEQESVLPIASQAPEVDRFAEHSWWDTGQGWKNILNNLRLILQPFIFSRLLWPWMLLFDLPCLRTGFAQLISIMNLFHARLPT